MKVGLAVWSESPGQLSRTTKELEENLETEFLWGIVF
jgi:hypothetical protein